MDQIKLPKIVQNYNTKNLNQLIETRSEQAEIVNAINSGYLIYPGADFILQRFQQQYDFDENNEKIINSVIKRKSSKSRSEPDNEVITSSFYFSFLHYLNAANVPIIEIGDISFCRNLKILDLSDNHLKKIDALSNCVKLIRLDLQNNQIIHLPDDGFWNSMSCLRILFLHSNPIGRLDYLKSLSASPALEILTLHDSPISLRKNYRHHVVNAITTLKALDYYCISDEEIIEEALYDPSSRFKAFSNKFFINTEIEKGDNDSYDTALRHTQKLICNVNKIIAYNSPVHILQKYTRGFIARNHFKYLLQSKRIAIFNNPEMLAYDETGALETSQSQSESNLNLKKWWKKSAPPRETPRTFTDNSKIITITNNNDSSLIDDSFNEIYRNKSADSRSTKRNIIIDLNKLNKLSYQNHHMSYRDSKLSKIRPNIDEETDEEKLYSFSRLVRLINEYDSQFQDPIYDAEVGSLVKKFSKQFNLQDPTRSEDLEETEFRLPMLIPDNSIIKVKEKYIVDLVKEKHDGSQAVKDMQFECHKKINQQRDEVKVIANDKPVTNDQRFFQKAFGNMTFGCLRAIDKAYADRNLVDAKHAQKLKVNKLKEQNKYSLQRVEYYKEDKIKEVQGTNQQQSEKRSTYDLKSEQDFEKTKAHVAEQRSKNNQLNKDRRKDVNLAVEFSKQHLSVSKALQKHEYITNREAKSKENMDFINKLKNNKEAQRELVRKYMQQRNVLRLIQSNNDRAIINKRLREDFDDELRNAKIRVEYLRYLEYNRRARVVLKKTKDENPTNILNVGERTIRSEGDGTAETTLFNEVN